MLKLYDTQSRKEQLIQPEDGKTYRFYCCGPTVYGPAHIGNFRTFIMQDVFRRVVEVAGNQTYHVRNLTDVDDKTIRQSLAEDMPLNDFTAKWTQKFHADCEQLNLLPPHKEPGAVDHIPQQITMIKELIDKGHAYVQKDGSVYFRVSSYTEYGRLARLDQSQLKTQEQTSGDARNLADEYDRETVADFALWKAHKPEDGPNKWSSPWGEGRPGWHIECSAMCREYLGDSFDMHGGGIDLIFPHHENEIAQSICCTGKAIYAKHWFHCAHLMVEGEKMSKSIGNLYTIDELVEKGYTPSTIRYALINGHYRQPLNFTFNGLHAASSALSKLEREISRLLEDLQRDQTCFKSYVAIPEADFFESPNTPFRAAWNELCNDLNIPGALGHIFSAMPFDAKTVNTPETYLKALGALAYALGLNFFEKEEQPVVEASEAIKTLAEKRWEARLNKDFEAADQLRDELLQAGWIVKDSRDSYTLTSV